MSTSSEKDNKKPTNEGSSDKKAGESRKTKDLPYVGRPNSEGRSRPAVILSPLKNKENTPQ